METKRIILSADDFGRSHERNLAIDFAFKQGWIKSAALMVNTDYTLDAVEMAKWGVFSTFTFPSLYCFWAKGNW